MEYLRRNLDLKNNYFHFYIIFNNNYHILSLEVEISF